jgi:hypothetical protein
MIHLSDRIYSVRWFQSFELCGVRTPGVKDADAELPRIALPDRLDGLTVLDVGANDGFFSFECERRGGAAGRRLRPPRLVVGEPRLGLLDGVRPGP